MAISYHLNYATQLSATEVAAQVVALGRKSGVFDAAVTAERLLGDGAATRLGMWMRVAASASPQPWDPIVTDLGFTPTVVVVFRLGNGVEASDQQDDMVRLVATLLQRIDGDAVLHFQYEEVWLLRTSGELTLSEDNDLWRPQRLALMTQPYRRETRTMDLD
jgi:hypothetical protein